MVQKVAFCLWGDRIAPRYDHSQQILIVTWENKKIIHEATLVTEHLEPAILCKMVAAQGVNTLVCGGVTAACRDLLTRSGVAIVDNIIGSSRAVLQHFLAGTLCSGMAVD